MSEFNEAEYFYKHNLDDLIFELWSDNEGLSRAITKVNKPFQVMNNTYVIDILS